jgi:hypothetical protein
MPSLESKIYSVLSAATAVTALTTRIYPEHRPAADALPAVVFSRVAGFRINTLGGFSNLENANVQVEVYTGSVDTRRLLADNVTTALTASTSFNAILTDSPFDSYEDEEALYIRTMDFSIWNKEV